MRFVVLVAAALAPTLSACTAPGYPPYGAVGPPYSAYGGYPYEPYAASPYPYEAFGSEQPYFPYVAATGREHHWRAELREERAEHESAQEERHETPQQERQEEHEHGKR
jgi:hypothetical protein